MWWRPKLKCKHRKSFGEKPLSNMKQTYRFSPYKSDTIGYGVSECSECGKRAFTCISLHMMARFQCQVIDSFINHEISARQFEQFLIDEMAWYECNEEMIGE
mgnify:CR=1 FL=1